MSNAIADVIVATCDEEIAKTMRGFGGKVIMTSKNHKNGTTRVAEAVTNIDCSHVMLLQGDEPLILPRHLEAFIKEIKLDPKNTAWNATGPIEFYDELDRNSFVKCAIGKDNRILFCFRRSPFYSDIHIQKNFLRKILGIIAYRKDFLLELNELPPSSIEQCEFIEQMRIIEYGHIIKSISVEPSLPSVNEPHEAQLVKSYVESSIEQQNLLKKYL
jgi:3-deoxy-manno-octulosonate cytidylyltransferase (CMP-KDO synthetase)